MKTKRLCSISVLVACMVIVGFTTSLAQPVSTDKQVMDKPSINSITPDALDMINDFAITYKIDPSDVNKDGVVDLNDTTSTKRGYAIAIQYADQMPANVKSILDKNRDGKVTGLDLVLATDNIMKVVVVNERMNRPVFKFVDMPAFKLLFKGASNLIINKDHSQKFYSFSHYWAYQPADTIKEEALMEMTASRNAVVNEEYIDMIDFGDLDVIIERVKYADFNFSSDSNAGPAPDEKWLAVYNSNLASGVRAKLDLEKANVLDEKDALVFNSFIARLATVIEYAKTATGSDSCSMTELSVDQDGNVQCLFVTGQDHELKVTISSETGVILNSKETLKAYDNSGNLTKSETATRVYDDSGTLQEAEYSTASYDSNGILISQIAESVKLDTASGAIVESSYKEAAIINEFGTVTAESIESTVLGADGAVTGSSISELRYNAAGVLIEHIASVSIYDNSGLPGTEIKLSVEYSLDATGKVTATNVYNDKKEKVAELSVEGYKEPDSIIESVKAVKEAELKAAHEAELKAAKEAADLKATQDAEAKAAKEAELKAAQEAADKAAKEAELKAAQDAAEKAAKEAELKAAQEAEQKAAKEAADLKAAKEAELKAAQEAELKAAHEAELKAAQEAAEKAAKEAERKAAETEMQKRLKAEILLAQEKAKTAQEAADLKAAKEAALKAAHDAELKALHDAADRAIREVVPMVQIATKPLVSESDMAKRLNKEILQVRDEVAAARDVALKVAEKETMTSDKEELSALELIQPVLEAAINKIAEVLREQGTDKKEIDTVDAVKLTSKAAILETPVARKGQMENNKETEAVNPIQSIIALVRGKVEPKAETETIAKLLAREMTNPMDKEALPLHEEGKMAKKEVSVPEPVQPDSELAQRKAVETQVHEQSIDKRFIGEMANPLNKDMLPLQNKNDSKIRAKKSF